MANAPKERLVVIGNGMAGARVVEEILARDPDRFTITMFGSEPYGNYNRILLSNVLNGSQKMEDIFLNPLAWYEENNIQLHCPCHEGFFTLDDGRPLAGPPKRSLPRILLQVKDEAIWATGMQV